jgi:hypothetical protein
MALVGELAYIAKPLNYFRIHGSSVTSTVDQTKVHVLEWLQVIRWILERVTPSDATLKKVREYQANRWVPAVLSFRVALDVKMSILDCVRAIDPYPIRRMFRPALAAIGRKISRFWPVFASPSSESKNDGEVTK